MDADHLTGVLLVNLGTPDAPDTRSVRRYLAEFLGDRRVLTMPAAARWALLHGVILRTRPRKSAEAYRQVWTDAGSPLLVHSRALAAEVANRLGEGYRVELAMRYGSPSIPRGLEALDQAGAERVIVLPLFPQYASAVTASVSAAVMAAYDRGVDFPPLEILGAFYDRAEFAASWAACSAAGLAEFAADHVLFSYHGLPEDQIRAQRPLGRGMSRA